jgi:hypothetical protein
MPLFCGGPSRSPLNLALKTTTIHRFHVPDFSATPLPTENNCIAQSLPEKLVVARLVKKFLVGTRRIITLFKTVRYWSLS